MTSERTKRVYINNPATIAECGGPCSIGGPELCDCSTLYRDVPETCVPKSDGREPESVGGQLSDQQAQRLFDSIRTPIYGRLTTDTQDRVVGYEPVHPGDFARAVLAIYGHHPAAGDGQQPTLQAAALFALTTLEGWANHGEWVWPVTALAQAKQDTSEAISALKAALDQYQPAPPAEGEVAELVDLLRHEADDDETGDHLLWMTAADMLSLRQSAPVSVSERPWEREGWCVGGICWWSTDEGPACWMLRDPHGCVRGWMLPYHAIAVPAFVSSVHSDGEVKA